MSHYRHLLVLVDLSADSPLVITRAKALAHDAQLTLLHVVEYVPVEPMGESMLPALKLETDLLARAQLRLAELAHNCELTTARQITVIGSIKAEAQRTATELGCDLIVVGNHERHGLAALVNFTEDAVLHVAPCDVLAIHLPRAR